MAGRRCAAVHAPESRAEAWRVEGGAALPCPVSGRPSPLAAPSRARSGSDGSESYACPAPVHVEGASERYAVTVRRREGKTSLGLRIRGADDGLAVVEVVCFGLLAEWNDNCAADVTVVPGDVIAGANDVEGLAAREVLHGSAEKVTLQLRRAVVGAQVCDDDVPEPEVFPGSAVARQVVRAFDDAPLVCCRCKRYTFDGRGAQQCTHGQWALWHLDRAHGGDERLLQGLWSQAAFPLQCELAAAVAQEEEQAAKRARAECMPKRVSRLTPRAISMNSPRSKPAEKARPVRPCVATKEWVDASASLEDEEPADGEDLWCLTVCRVGVARARAAALFVQAHLLLRLRRRRVVECVTRVDACERARAAPDETRGAVAQGRRKICLPG